MPRLDSPIARIDSRRTVAFSFDGRPLTGHPGDTLASALVANGVRVVGQSPYLNRPRGVFSAGVEEPNALVELDLGTHSHPMACATSIELHDGLTARSLAGRGRFGAGGADPSRYDRRHAHCDVLVVGGGIAGLTAARAAASAGARVILVDEQSELGGGLLSSTAAIDGQHPAFWLAETVDRLAQEPDTVLLRRTTAVGVYEQGYVVAVERRTEHLPPEARPGSARQRVWHVRARQIVLATGAIERPVVFADNDRPGVMLAGAAQSYANRYAAAPGSRAVVFTTNDTAYTAANELLDRGIEVAAFVDTRAEPPPAALAALARRGVDVRAGSAVVAADSADGLSEVRVAPIDENGRSTGDGGSIRADLLAVSGGWTPTLHLYAQAGGRLRYSPEATAHVPSGTHPFVTVAGAAAGTFSIERAMLEAETAGHQAARRAVGETSLPTPASRAREEVGATAGDPAWARPAHAVWAIGRPDQGDWGRHFVDLHRDATVADLHRAVGAGLRSIEHLKRYTTVGTGPDQGKTSNLNAIGIAAGLLGEQIESISPTTYRPMYTPVAFAALAGRDRGVLLEPVRTTPIHPWHEAQNAVFENAAQWKRPLYYPRDGEDFDACVRGECLAVRTGVGMMDASTLGKIDVQGPDAGELLDRVYTNMMSTLKVGACRYGLMCHLDGVIFDDGVVMRLADERFLVTTTTGHAAAVLEWLEMWLQTEWPELDVRFTNVTDHGATVVVAGPRSRDVLSRVVSDAALDQASMPFMAIADGTLAGAPVRVCRVSFSGELAYEVHTSARYGLTVWQAVFEAGQDHGIAPYGTEALTILRAEKGFIIVGQDTDSTVTPQDAGMGWAVSKKKDFFLGSRSHSRVHNRSAQRRQLVGLLPDDPQSLLTEGAQLLAPADGAGDGRARTAGHVTSSYYSASLGHAFALALLEGGHDRLGETVRVSDRGQVAEATVTTTVFYDPEGARRDGDPTHTA